MTATADPKRRSSFEIVAHMLTLLASGISSKTAIMYQANMSFGQLNYYRDVMLERGLITANGPWRMTERGRAWLEAYTMLLAITDGIPVK
nr:winged helix-turn-helix domain-containing protein [uncultured Nitrososphaera sp.]